MCVKEQVKEKVDGFEAYSRENAHFGACDSEPQEVFEKTIEQHIHSPSSYKGPQTASDWQLFSDMCDVEEVAKEMTSLVREICSTISRAPIGDMEEIVGYLKTKFWRVEI